VVWRRRELEHRDAQAHDRLVAVARCATSGEPGQDEPERARLGRLQVCWFALVPIVVIPVRPARGAADFTPRRHVGRRWLGAILISITSLKDWR
jgi:hypothetical protein